MSDAELLARIEQQAVEIASLKSQVASYQRRVADLDKQMADIPNQVYRRMADGEVNCGSSYGCGLARMYLERTEKK